MSDDEYEAISEAEWKALATTEITHLTDEEEDYLPRAWDEWIARVRRDAKAEALTKRWVCQVARSGYHNGASCRPSDAHDGWGCDYYYEASIRATEYEAGGRV